MKSIFDTKDGKAPAESPPVMDMKEYAAMQSEIGRLTEANKLLAAQLEKFTKQTDKPSQPKSLCRLIWNPYDTRFQFVCGYDDKDLPKSAGFRWDPDKKAWWTDQKEIALQLIAFADEKAKEELGDAEGRQ